MSLVTGLLLHRDPELLGELFSTESWTRTRLVLTQVWPTFLNLPAMQPATARSGSADSNTMNIIINETRGTLPGAPPFFIKDSTFGGKMEECNLCFCNSEREEQL